MNNNNRSYVKLDYQQLKGEALKKLLEFCFRYADTVSLSQSNNIGMTMKEAEQATVIYYEYLDRTGMEEGKRPTMEDMLNVFKDMAETEEELKELINREREAREKYDSRYKKSDEEVVAYIKTVFDGYQLMDREVTCMTPCTMGGPCTMYYLKPDEKLKSDFYRMTDLFQPVIEAESMELRLDDPVFYIRGEILLLVCTHENYASLMVTPEQYDDLKGEHI